MGQSKERSGCSSYVAHVHAVYGLSTDMVRLAIAKHVKVIDPAL